MATPVQIAPNGQHSVFVFPKNGAETVPDATLISQLLHAASRGNLHMLGNLLEKHAAEGLTASSCDYDKRTALHLAASEGLVEVAKFLVERPDCDVNTKDRWQGTPLDDAVRHRHSELVDFLVARGAVTGDDNKVTQEFMAAVEANDIETVANLLRSGASPSAADYDQRSVLHIAVSKGNERIIRLLVETGGDLNVKDTFGLTPLDEAARRGTRTGENKIRDLLLSLGASKPGADVPTEGSSRLFVWTSWVVQLIFLALFAAVTDFGVGTASESSARMVSVYSMFVDVHVMIVVGFGFLMTFLRKYGYSSVGFNLLIATMVIQWHILCGGFVHQLFAAVTTQGGYVWHKIHISVTSLLLADFAAAAVLITFGALLGKVTPLQLYVVGLCEILFFAVNENIIVGRIGIVDVGGSVIVHVFGAYFGLAASKVLTPLRVMDDGNNGANYHSDLFAMIGTAFLWIYWPSFVAAPAGEADRELAVISTLLSLTGSCIAAFQVSHLMRERQFCMVDVQNATLAGGVAIGSIANLAIQSPAIAIATGAASGALSVVGYTRVQVRAAFRSHAARTHSQACHVSLTPPHPSPALAP